MQGQSGLCLQQYAGSSSVYYWLGSLLLAERRVPAAGSTVPARTLMFNYDENNSPVGFQFKSDVSNYWYFYVFAKNAQGDITSIYRRDVDANGKTYLSHIADYEYDPWGRVLSVKDSTGRDISNEPNNSAAINPFRYRGYYYDAESGFYYLQSRYYDPVIKRFLNADSFASTGTGYLGYNMFAYCNNNPITYADRSGHMFCRVNPLEGSGGGGYSSGEAMNTYVSSGTSIAPAPKEVVEERVGKQVTYVTDKIKHEFEEDPLGATVDTIGFLFMAGGELASHGIIHLPEVIIGYLSKGGSLITAFGFFRRFLD